MPAIITANSLVGEKPPELLYKDNDELYEYIMYYEGNRYIAYADDPADLLEILIPGYENMTADERLDARLAMSLRMQAQAQAQITVNLTEEQKAQLAPWELKCIAGTYNEERPYQIRGFWKERLPEGIDPESIPEDDRMDVWSADVELVLIDVAYFPWIKNVYPPLGNPEGTNILWIKPSDEIEFLESLTDLGFISFAPKRH